jgi:tetratricopeptide (TPR) repeat protein
MRCPVCGAPIALGAPRCAICGHGLERPTGAPSGASDRAAEIFVGREREMALLGEALDDALDGHGRLVLLVGEPGIGKTRLGAELSMLARRRGARVLVGRAWETEGAPPYWPWAQILRALLAEPDVDTVRGEIAPYAEDLAHLVPELGGLVRGAAPAAGVAEEEARFRFFASFARWLDVSSRHRPLVLVLDDLHWFDVPSLRLLELLARDLQGAPVLILGAYRDVGLQSDHALSQLVGAVIRESFCRRVELGGLPAADVARLVEHAIGEPAAATLVRAMLDETQGNPFFLTETLRLLVAERRSPPEAGTHRLAPSVPHGVRAAIGRRLEGLSAPCRKVLLLAAMLGREFGAPALEALGAQRSLGPTGEWLYEALEEAVEARLIAVVPRAIGRYSFTHALIREALYEELNPARRARLHRDIAPVVEALAGLGPDALPSTGAGRFLAEVAYHHLQALPAGGDLDRAVAYAIRAGDWAMDVFAYEDAVLHYRRAQDALDAGVPDDARRAELLLRLGHAAAKAGEVDLAQHAFERTLELARRLRGQSPAALLFARAVLGLGGEWWMDPIDLRPRFLELLEEALDRLDAGDSALRAQVLSRLVVRLYFVPDAGTRRRTLAEQAVGMARRVGDPVTLVRALGARHWALWDPDHLDERLAVTSELVYLAEDTGARDLAFQAHVFRLGDLLEVGRIDAVDDEIETIARLADELRQPLYQWWTPMFRAMRALLEGRLDEAERCAEAGAAIGQRVQGRVAIPIFGSYLVWLRRAQGRIAELLAVVKGMVDQYRSEISWRTALAFIESDLDRRAPARDELERLAAADFADVPQDLRRLPTLAMLAQVAAYLGDARRASLLYDLMRPYAEHVIAMASGAGPCMGAASRYLGLLATVGERWDEAERHFEDAIARNGRMRAHPQVAFAQHEWGVMLMRRDRRGDRDRARELFASALATARALGMTGLRERIEAIDAGGAGPSTVAEPARPSVPPSTAANVFHRDGEYWTLVYQGGVCRLKDAKGLRYLAELLQAPAREFHVLDLAALTGGRPSAPPGLEQVSVEQLAADDLHVAGPARKPAPVDAQARLAYKQRLAELREEQAEAQRFNDEARATRLGEEIEFLSGELAAAYGGGGRARKGAGADEQVRKNVTNCIRNSVARIHKSNPVLGRHLLAAVKTGVFCSYRPEQPVVWRA